MSELVAVQGLTLQPTGIVTVPGTITITSVPSTVLILSGSGVYTASLNFTVTGASATGYDPGSVTTVGTASIPATAVKALSGGSAVMRQGDSNPAVAMTGTVSGTPTPFTEPWEISIAGQTKVSAN